jgi:hypothetical protein
MAMLSSSLSSRQFHLVHSSALMLRTSGAS